MSASNPVSFSAKLRDRIVHRVRHFVDPIVAPILQTVQALGDQMETVRHQHADLCQVVESHNTRLADLAEQVQSGQAIGWDHAALVRRLAVLEDRIEELTADFERRQDEASEVAPTPAPSNPLSKAG